MLKKKKGGVLLVWFVFKNEPMQEEKRRVSRISKYSKCLAEEEERQTLHPGTRWKEAQRGHPPSAVCQASRNSLNPLFSVFFAAGVQHLQSSN